MAPTRLERQWRLLDAAGTGVVATGKAEAFCEEGPVGPGFQRYVDWLGSLRTHEDHLAGAFLECFIASPSWMMRRSDFLACGGHGAVGIPEDYCLALRWLAEGMRIEKVPETVLYWRDHPHRATRTLPEYADNHYWDLKVRSLRPVLGKHIGNRRFAVWGMGDTGKSLTRALIVAGETPACLVTDNLRKQGILWEGIPVRGPGFVDRDAHYVLSAVSARGGWEEISATLGGRGFAEVGISFGWGDDGEVVRTMVMPLRNSSILTVLCSQDPGAGLIAVVAPERFKTDCVCAVRRPIPWRSLDTVLGRLPAGDFRDRRGLSFNDMSLSVLNMAWNHPGAYPWGCRQNSILARI